MITESNKLSYALGEQFRSMMRATICTYCVYFYAPLIKFSGGLWLFLVRLLPFVIVDHLGVIGLIMIICGYVCSRIVVFTIAVHLEKKIDAHYLKNEEKRPQNDPKREVMV